MNYIYLVKVFNIKEGEFIPTLEEETVAVCTDKDRAEEILEHNMYRIDDRCYDYGLIVTVVDGKGYLGEGKYKAKENGKLTDEYNIYHDMLKRCYYPKYQERYPTYKGCKVEDYLLNFQHMGEWIDDNYYEIPGEKMCLDKDILCKGNKMYSRDTCIFVPNRINVLFTKRDNARGKNPIGMTELPSGNYQAYCNNGYGKNIYLGVYSTKEEAFQVYKKYKEKVIKEVIDSYEGIIPEPFYSRLKTAMYNYEVEIDD